MTIKETDRQTALETECRRAHDLAGRLVRWLEDGPLPDRNPRVGRDGNGKEAT